MVIVQSQAQSTYHSELLEAAGLLNVLQSLLEVLELQVNLLLGSLGVLDGLSLKGVNGLELAADVVGGGLEGLEALLNLVDDSLVLELRAVDGKVDGRGQLRELLHLAPDVVVARLEGLQRGDGLAAQAEGGLDLCPVELQGCGALQHREEKKNQTN